MNRNYWKPADANVGDCMPFVHNGLFHVYYLRDLGHHNHPVVGSLGGHEWAHCVSSDLKHFEECPVALNLDFESGECSNCTGSLFAHGEAIYAFYALRSRNFKGEQFRVAVSSDGGRTFKKWDAPELATPPPGYTGDFRDPSIFVDETGTNHLLLTSRRASTGITSPALAGELLHYTTKDFIKYTFEGTFLKTNGIPECSELFRWGDYYYLFYSLNWETHTLVSESLSGPWRVAAQDIPASRFCAVMKSVPWKNNRRVGVAWVPPQSRSGFQFGGKMIFRELIQNPDGSLGTSFLPEALAGCAGRISLEDREIAESGGLAQIFLGEVPEHFRLEGEIDFSMDGAHSFGFQLSDTTGNFRRLIEFFPYAGRVEIDRTAGASLWDTREGKVFFRLERSGDILDLEFGGKRTLTVSGWEFSPSSLFFQVVGGHAALKNATLFELPKM